HRFFRAGAGQPGAVAPARGRGARRAAPARHSRRWSADQRRRVARPGRRAGGGRSRQPADRLLGRRYRADQADPGGYARAALGSGKSLFPDCKAARPAPKTVRMPIWMELTVLMFVAYAAGLALGWAIWKPRRTGRETDD